MKDVVTMQQDVCGTSQYFGDEYYNGQCQLKKCSDECIPGVTEFSYNYLVYTRTRYCCTTDFCNSATKLNFPTLLASALVILLVAMMMMN